jgi:ATP-dependent DNA helicase RecQ
MTTPRPLLSIGYGRRSMDEFLALLVRYDVTYIGDIRSRAYSRFNPDFSRDKLQQRLAGSNINYVFMGDTLGGDPEDESVRIPAGGPGHVAKHRVLYELVSELPSYKRGISRLRRAWEQSAALALMCSEAKPEFCHRVRLIGATLEEESIPLVHIDERGELVSQQDVMLRINNGQATLPEMGPSPKAAKSSRSF